MLFYKAKIITGNSEGAIVCGGSPTITNNTIMGNLGTGISCSGSLMITNNIITGNSGTHRGGGIYCGGSTIVTGNIIADNSGGDSGGGIYCDGSSATIERNTITGNSAYRGGGIYCDDSPTIVNNVITGNSAYRGGGIHCGGSPTLTNNTITGNSAANSAITGSSPDTGGGIYGGSPTITNTILWNNSPQEICASSALTISYSDVQGGLIGVFTNDNGTVNWLDGNINSPPLFADAANGDYHLSDYSLCIGAGTSDGAPTDDIEGNTRGTPPDMGAYENSRNAPLPRGNPVQIYVSVAGDDMTGDGSQTNPYRTIQKGIDESFNGCTVLVDDGIYTGSGNVNLDFGSRAITVRSLNGAEDCIIDCENADDTRGFYFHGGETSDSVVDGFTIRNGKSINGGGGIYCLSSSPTIRNNTIAGSWAGWEVNGGGGILCSHFSSPTITNNTITANTTKDHSAGGAISSGALCSPTIVSNVITGNSAAEGGGIHCGYNSSPTITSNTIADNLAGRGGGIVCHSSSPKIEDNMITRNSAQGGAPCNGGGIYCDYNSSPMITNNTITENSATHSGGGIGCDSSSPIIRDNTIVGNSANKGGGIDCQSSSSPTVINNIITGNAGGGLSCQSSSSPTATSNTITGNIGGGLYCVGNSSPTIANTILWNNSPQEIYLSASHDPCTVTISYSDVKGGQAGIVTNNNGTVNWLDGNIDTDPLFADAANGDYHLSDYSLCIGVGTRDGDPATDIEGNPRPNPPSSNPDMGAYENSLGEPLSSLFQSEMMELGWNLISLSLQPFNTDPGTVLNSIYGQYNSDWDYDPDTGWSVYTPNGPYTLTKMERGKGYWIEMNQPGTLVIQGTDPGPEPIYLKGGKWNLVGHNSLFPLSIGNIVPTMPDGTCIYTYDSEEEKWLKYFKGGPSFLNNLELLEPGHGYWFYVEQDWAINY